MSGINKQIRILFIEDLESDYELAIRELKKENIDFTSIRVETENEMLKSLSDFMPDIIISDYSMPQFNGMKALQLSLKHSYQTPFIILTGSMNEETAVKCMKAGATDYVIKERIKRLPFAVNEALERAYLLKAARTAEKELILSEERFRKLAENAQDLIFRYELNPKPRFVYVSPSSVRLTGYTPHEFYTNYRLAYTIIHDDEKHILKHLGGENQENDKPITVRLIRKDSKVIWIELVGVFIYSNTGELIAIEGVVRDITDRKLAEEALLESESKYRILFEGNPNPMWVYDTETLRFLAVNDIAVSTYGYSRDEFLSMTIKDIRPDNQVSDLLKNVDEVTGSIQRSGPWIHKYKDGTTVYVEIVSHIIEFEGKPARIVVAHDVTEQINSTLALAEQRQLAQATLDSINANICVLNENGEIIAINKLWIDFAVSNGANLEAVNVHSNYFNVCEVATGSDIEIAMQMKAGILSVLNGESGKFEIEYECHSPHEERWYMARVTPFESENPDQKRVVIAHEDITQRKHAEALVRESEERYTTFMNSASDVVYIKDENLKYVMMNKAGVDTIKKPLTYILGKTDFELLKYEYAHSYSLSDKEAIEKNKLVVHSETIGERVYETRKFPVKLAMGKIGVGCFIRDVTDRHLAQKAIQESEKKYRSLVENSLVGVFTTNTKGDLLFANSALCKILEFNSIADLMSDKVGLAYKNQIDRERFIEVLRTKDQLFNYEIELLTSKGNSRTVTLAAVMSGDTISGMMMDITEKKRVELEILLKNQEIEAQNEEYRILNEELFEARVKAEESDRLKTAFLQNLSHEIRTPMNGIVGFTQLLKEGTGNIESKQQYLEMIEKSGNRLMNIIGDLVEISKIETGHISVFSSKFKVNDVLNELYLYFKRLADEKGIELIIINEKANENLFLNSDRGKIFQVISNLINNAIKFTENGQVTFGVNLSENGVEFFVRDTGIGIRPEIQDIIFERFRQADTSISRGYEGAGLGLSISKAYIEKLGGNITVESEVGKGSTFKFTLPNNSNDFFKSKSIIMDTSKKHLSSNKRALVVEDDVVSRLLLSEILKNSEIQVIFARNGQEAVDIVKADDNSIDFILMDLKMPIMNGYDATLIIRELGFTKPIIAQTAYASKDDEKRVLASGFDAYLSKPVHKNLLVEILADIETRNKL